MLISRPLLASRLRRWRLVHDFTSEQIAHQARISRPLVSHMERGTRSLNIKYLLILRSLGMSLEYLITGKEPSDDQ